MNVTKRKKNILSMYGEEDDSPFRTRTHDRSMKGGGEKAVIKAVENVGKPVEKNLRKGTMRRSEPHTS